MRFSLVLRIPEIYTRCRELSVPEFDFFLNDPLLEIVMRYLQDADVEVSNKAYVTTMALLHKRLLSKEAIEQKLCPAIVKLSRMTITAHQMDYETNSIEVGLKIVLLISACWFFFGFVVLVVPNVPGCVLPSKLAVLVRLKCLSQPALMRNTCSAAPSRVCRLSVRKCRVRVVSVVRCPPSDGA